MPAGRQEGGDPDDLEPFVAFNIDSCLRRNDSCVSRNLNSYQFWLARSSSGPGRQVLNLEITGSNPVRATN